MTQPSQPQNSENPPELQIEQYNPNAPKPTRSETARAREAAKTPEQRSATARKREAAKRARKAAQAAGLPQQPDPPVSETPQIGHDHGHGDQENENWESWDNERWITEIDNIDWNSPASGQRGNNTQPGPETQQQHSGTGNKDARRAEVYKQLVRKRGVDNQQMDLDQSR